MDIENWNGKYLKCFWIVQEILNIEIRWIRGVMSQLKASICFAVLNVMRSSTLVFLNSFGWNFP